MNWQKLIGSLGLALTVALALPVRADEASYTPHGRISYDAGSNLVKGAEDADWGHATVNTPLLAGDTLWVDEGGTSEVEFSGGTFLRAADGSKIEIYALPPTALFRGWNGSTYLQRLQGSSGDITFETPAAKIYVEPDTMVRVDIMDKGATKVSVRYGHVTVKAFDGNGTVRMDSGESVYVDPGMLPSEPTPFDLNREDALDSWNRERAALLVDSTRNVPKEVVIREDTVGVSDLGQYGEWVYVDNRPYWRPTVVTNYVPYRYGYWSTVPRIGQVWVDNYPFSYVTCHYGRWQYTSAYGWCWSYDPVWSPAWVATIRCGDYYVWSPIGYDCRPVVFGGTRFVVGGVDFYIGAASYVPVTYFGYGPRYIYGCYPEFGTYVNHATQINIWNINIGGRDNDRYRVPYTRDLPVERDYFPRRSIRGLSDLEDGRTQLATDRVNRLEQRLGRTSFDTPERGRSARNERTSLAPERRNAEARQVRLTDLSNPEASRLNPRTRQEVESRIGRAADRETGRPVDEPRPTRETLRAQDDGNVNDVRTRRGADAPARLDTVPTLNNDDARSAGRVRNDRSRAETGDSERAPERGRNAERDNGRTPRTTTIDGNVDSPRTRTPESDTDTAERERPRLGGSRATEGGDDARSRTRDVQYVTPRRTQAPGSGDTSRAPSVTIRGRSSAGPSLDDAPVTRLPSSSRTPAASPERTPSRGESMRTERPSYSAPERERVSAPETRSVPRVERPEPRSISRPEPRVEPRSTPQRVERPEPQFERSAPQRVERSAPQPRMEQRSAPQFERSAPQPRMEQRSAPQIERSVPQRVERSAPSSSSRGESGGRSRGNSERGR